MILESRLGRILSVHRQFNMRMPWWIMFQHFADASLATIVSSFAEYTIYSSWLRFWKNAWYTFGIAPMSHNLTKSANFLLEIGRGPL